MLGTVTTEPAPPWAFQAGEAEEVLLVTIPTPVGPYKWMAALGRTMGTDLDADLGHVALQLAHRALERNPITALTFPA